ncbi:MAG: aminoglycoside phosphotransferase family protein [Clostridia bacterium]|nr:aminoglycoside phosphotransferase family protein [Clostridia bacterium]
MSLSQREFSFDHLREQAGVFAPGSTIASVLRNEDGHINDTFIVEIIGGDTRRFIMQRVNDRVFTDPQALMRNMTMVTEYLRERVKEQGGDVDREVLTLWRTAEGKVLHRACDGGLWRAFTFVEGALTVQRVTCAEQLYEAGSAFGRFQNLLSEFAARELAPVIPDFHNTRARFAALEAAIQGNPLDRAAGVRAEIDFALARRQDARVLQDLLDAHQLPLRVTHNDTKINNVMLDADTGHAVCVIDLDTVMPGSMLFDFGDAIRSGVNTADEDETDLSRVRVDLDYYRAFARGFLEQTGSSMTELERELLPFAAKMMTYECGIRFLTDHLLGDAYFRIHRPGHNLDRARTQFKLVAEMERLEPELRRIQDEL